MLHVRDIMTTDVATVGPDTTLRDAAELFATRHIGGAPVIDAGKVVGVVSASDILAFEASTPTVPTTPGLADATEATGEWDELPGWELEEPASRFFVDGSEDESWSEVGEAASAASADAAGPSRTEWDTLAEHTVAEAMTRRVLALPPAVDVSAAADRMRTAGVHRVLVMEHGTLLGIVTTTDLARAVADHRITARRFVFDSPRVRAGDAGDAEQEDSTDAVDEERA